MKKTLIFSLFTLSLSASSALAEGQTLLVCQTRGGGTVTVQATDSNQKVDLVMDEDAQRELGVSEARGLDAMLESADGASVAGPIDLVEIGAGWYDEKGKCGLGLELNSRNQALGQARDVALKPSFSYNAVECGKAKAQLESCQLGAGLSDVSALKKFVHIVVAD